MEMIGTENFGAYARKMLIDGYIIVVDYTEQKKLAAEINKIGVNINTVCRRINSTGRFYQDDIDELKEKMDAVWQLLMILKPVWHLSTVLRRVANVHMQYYLFAPGWD